MPKSPINHREIFFARSRASANAPDPIYRQLDWNCVQTDLGPMVESRNLGGLGASSSITNMDLNENGANKISLADEDSFYQQYNTGGAQLVDFNV